MNTDQSIVTQDIVQEFDYLTSFSKLSVGDKRKHLYAMYVIEELVKKSSITIIDDEFSIYNLDIGYMDTFNSKDIESKLYGKKQSKPTTKIVNESDITTHSDSDESSITNSIHSSVPETPSKKARKPRAKKTDEVGVDENGVPATPSKTPRKPRAKKTDEVVLDENGVPETPSKKASKPRAKKTELVPIAEDPVQPVEQQVEQVVVPETPSKKASKPRAKKTDEDGVPETPSKKARKPRAKKEGELTIIPEEILPTPIVREELVTVPAAPAGPEAPDVQPVEQTVADKIIDCIPDTKGKKKTADKTPKTPSKKNNKTAEPIVAEPIVDRPVTPELVEEELPIISIVEAETEDGVTVTYLLEEKTGKIYNADDHKLKTQIGILSEEGDLQLFE